MAANYYYQASGPATLDVREAGRKFDQLQV
jgi:hypothetical protein